MKIRAFSTREFNLEIVGESHYQKALKEAKESAKDYSGRGYVDVYIVPEPDNPYDDQAIKVTLTSGETIGYLSRANARKYARAAANCEDQGIRIKCQAILSGGETTGMLFWKKAKDIGAWLDLDTPRAITSKVKK